MRDEPADPLPSPALVHPPGASVAAESRICPYLRSSTEDGAHGDPVHWPDADNRCIALGDPAPQSRRQQEFACLASTHVGCQRFIRARGRAEMGPEISGQGPRLTPSIVGSLLVLAASFVLSVGFVVANGGLDLRAVAAGDPGAGLASPSAPGASSGSVAAASASAVVPSAAPSPMVTDSTSAPTPRPTEVASQPAVTPTPTPVVIPTRAPTQSPAPTPQSSSDRYLLLKPCPDEPECWIYTVRSGDNLVSIARYFGFPLDVVIELNPWTETTQLIPDQELRLPPPAL